MRFLIYCFRVKKLLIHQTIIKGRVKDHKINSNFTSILCVIVKIIQYLGKRDLTKIIR